ncbi:MAG: hypothetical protein M1818_008144 [Claussenomyces sp. TS43310]|nr:MAG: hypothetical protein M1818_008144 [Claussenomyces sp. TS43310]
MTAASQPAMSFSRETFAKLSPHPYLLAHLQPPSTASAPVRANGRSSQECRGPHINNGSLTHAEGSALIRVGDTTAVCGVRSEILLASDVPGYRVDKSSTSSGSNCNELQELDLLVPNIELATGCSPSFLPGQSPSVLAQSLSTRIYSLIHSCRIIDPDDLRIWYYPPGISEGLQAGEEDLEAVEPEVKAFWTLYIDILFISLDGNPFDAAWAAVLSALKDVRLPYAYWDIDREMILCSDELSRSKKLKIRGLPIASTYAVFRAKEQAPIQRAKEKYWVLADPDAFEESLCDETVTMIVDSSSSRGSRILGISKYGGVMIGKEEMKAIMSTAERKWKGWSKIITSTAAT